MASQVVLDDKSSEDKDDLGSSCITDMAIEDIVLLVALGHSLQRSQSLFVVLPCEVIRHSLAGQIWQLYEAALAERGLLTPVEVVALVLPRPVARRKIPPNMKEWSTQRACEPFASAPRTVLTLCDFGCNHEDPLLSLDEDCDRILGVRQHVNASNSK